MATRRLAEYGAAVAAACALSLGFPKAGVTWLVPFALVPLIWGWSRRTPAQAARLGYVAGLVYFSIMFSWAGNTAGELLGPFGFVIVVVPAAIEALAFAACGALSAYATARLPIATQPLAFAAAFTLCEWARSSGVLGVPFAQLGVTQAGGPLAALGAFIGAFGITFVLCALAGYLFVALTAPAAHRVYLLAFAIVAAGSIAAWWWWPARNLAVPTIPVAAIQGNIKQGLKWTPESIRAAIERYVTLSAASASRRPQLIVWPETVVAEFLSNDPLLRARFTALARNVGIPIVVGSLDEVDRTTYYNALFIFGADGTQRVYRKHQLVPFAEFLPLEQVFGNIPATQFISRFSSGSYVGPEPAGALSIGPLICWESAFADIANAEARRGAELFVVSTDDGWFGETSGPYQHAQIAQMRAIETGRWIVRAAATGISGIIAPNGRYVAQAPLDVETIVFGNVGLPQAAPFVKLGPNAIALACAILYCGLIATQRGARRA